MDSITGFLTSFLGNEGGLGIGQILGAIAVAYLGGVLSSLTPCVYPMIPITVSVVGGMGGNKTRRTWQQMWLRGAVYVAGMAIVYAFLGVVAGLTGQVFGSMTSTSGWYLGLGAIMTLAALIMMDVIPFDPAAAWLRIKVLFGRNKATTTPLHGHEQEMTLLGAFALGTSSGFIAAPCTTPVLTAVLAYIAKTQSVTLGLALMLSFSIGMGTLLLVVAAFAGALQLLPRSGAWMRTIKVVSGLLLLLLAQYLVYQAGKLGGLS